MRVTASKLGLLAKCGWFARPEVRVPWEESGPAALFGTTGHALIESAITGAPAPAIPEAVDAPRVLAAVDQWRKWWAGGDGWNAEMRLAYDTATGRARELPRGSHRDYSSATSSEIVGTADAVAVGDDCVIVWDWKLGRPENVDAAEENRQLSFLGLAAARLFRRPKARVGLSFVSTSGVTEDVHELDAFDLEQVEYDLRQDVARIPAAEPAPGDHCKWCPARAVCPAGPQALATVGPERRLPIVGTAAELRSPEHAAYQLAALYAVKAYINAAWDAVRRYADEHDGIPLGDGKKWARVEGRRESLDLSTQQAVEALKSALGEHWQKAVDLSTSKTAIKEAARAVAQVTNRKIVDVEREAIQALRAVGAVKVTTTNTYEETASS
jgi:hypothetical protein